MKKSKIPQPRSTREVIWECICDLDSQGQTSTREIVRNLTGLKQTTVDDHVGNMINSGRLTRMSPGVFKPSVAFPPTQSVSATFLPGGMVKVERGDDLLNLTPYEARLLGLALNGCAQQYAGIQQGEQTTKIANQLDAELKEARHVLRAQAKRIDELERLVPQMRLDLEPAQWTDPGAFKELEKL
jgi:hypothetical protein